MAVERTLTFVCDLCNAKCSTKRSAERHHKMAHSGENPIQCDLCPRMFALKFLKDVHQESHNPQVIKCEVCGKDLRSKNMKVHMRNVHGPRKQINKVNCNMCGKIVGDNHIKGHLKIHEAKQKQSQIETCTICKKNYSFQDGKDLSMHIAKHALAKKYQCNFCKKFFGHKSTLTSHNRIQTGEKPFSCKYCSLHFNDLSSRNQHKRNQHEGRHTNNTNDKQSKIVTETCPVCKKQYQFQDGKDLSMHIAKHALPKKYQCNVCEKYFGCNSNLTKHAKRHTGEKTLSCKYCSFFFRDSAAKNHHERKHTTNTDDKLSKEHEKSLCKVCGKLVIAMKSHMATHALVNTLACDLCQQKFHDKYSMKRHISIVHLNYKPYSCGTCQKSYTLRFSLKNHEELHQGLQLKCKVCEKMFPTHKLLAQHDKSMHRPQVQKAPIICKICEKTLFNTATLTRHNLLVHSKIRPFSCKSCFRTFALRSMMNTHTKDSHNKKHIKQQIS